MNWYFIACIIAGLTLAFYGFVRYFVSIKSYTPNANLKGAILMLTGLVLLFFPAITKALLNMF